MRIIEEERDKERDEDEQMTEQMSEELNWVERMMREDFQWPTVDLVFRLVRARTEVEQPTEGGA